MTRKAILIVLCVILAAGCASLSVKAPAPSIIGNLPAIEKTDRILILAPHPDDEAIGCAGIIQEAVSKGADIRVVYMTNGDHNQVAFIVYEKRLTFRKDEFIHMGQLRRKEAIQAMKLLGLDEKNLIFLGYPDFGTFTIFKNFWQSPRPYQSVLTRISSVPYKENFSFGAPYKGESILADLKKVLREYRPNKIFVSHPADANVDHKAFYLFLEIALRDLEKKIPQPKIYPYLIHCIGWPLPRHYHPRLNLEPPRQFSGSQAIWLRFALTPAQLNKKHRAILRYKSQTESSAFYLLSFARQNELFGDYPDIELRRQDAAREQAALFSGLSNMFNDSKQADWDYAGNLNKGKSQVSYAISGDNLLIRIDKPKELNRKFSMQFYLFGYSRNTPFSVMPKVRIITRYKKFRVFNGRKMIKPAGLSLGLKSKELILEIPLKILGEPDFILAAVKTYAGALRTDTTSFRRINIK